MFSVLFYLLYRPWISLHEGVHMLTLELFRRDYEYLGYVPEKSAFIVRQEDPGGIPSFLCAISPIFISIIPIAAFIYINTHSLELTETLILIYIGVFGSIAAVPSMQDALSSSASCLSRWYMLPLIPLSLMILLPIWGGKKIGISWIVPVYWIAYCRFLALEIVPQVI